MPRALLVIGLLIVAALIAAFFALRSPEAEVELVEPVVEPERPVGRREVAAVPRPEPPELEQEPEPDEVEDAPPVAVAPEPEPEPASVSLLPAGDVTGRIVLDGEAPRLEPLIVTQDQRRGCCEPDETFDTTDRTLVVDDTNGVAFAVVTIAVEGAPPRPPLDEVHVEMSRCRFEPHVQAVPAGTILAVRNADPLAHNLHTYSQRNGHANETFGPREELLLKLDRPERFEIKCDIHPWEGAWLVVADTPFLAVTDASGRFTIEDLPAGEHRVDVWHELLGEAHGTATVTAGVPADDVEIGMTWDEER